MIWYILLATVTLIIAFFLQAAVHEGSHLIAGKLKCSKLKLKAFRIYPHWYSTYRHQPWKFEFKRPWPEAKFAFARVEWLNCTPTKLVHAAPLIGDVASFVLFGIIAILLGQHWAFVGAFLIAPVIDFAWWWRGYFWGSERADGKRYKQTRGW